MNKVEFFFEQDVQQHTKSINKGILIKRSNMVSFKRGSKEMKELQLIGCILTSAKRPRKKEPLIMKKNGHHQDQTLH